MIDIKYDLFKKQYLNNKFLFFKHNKKFEKNKNFKFLNFAKVLHFNFKNIYFFNYIFLIFFLNISFPPKV